MIGKISSAGPRFCAKKTYGERHCPFTCKHVARTYGYKEGLCPRAEDALEHLICVPWDESWTKADVERVVKAVAKTMDRLRSMGSSALRDKAVGKASASIVDRGNRKSKVRVGIVGCGQTGRWHFDAYIRNPHTEIVSVADTNFRLAEAFAHEGNAAANRSHQEMLENEVINAVSICTVLSTHGDIALEGSSYRTLHRGFPFLSRFEHGRKGTV